MNYTLPNKKNFKLSPEQQDIVEFLLQRDYAMNCSQTGIGKTFSTLTAAIHKILERPQDDIHFILLMPLSAVTAFERELQNLQLPYNLYSARRTKAMKDARFHIFNYSTLPKDVIKKDRRGNVLGIGTNKYFETFKKLRREHPNLWLIADEAHALQDPTTIQYLFVKEMMPLFCGAWFLTATPLLNDVEGLFHMTELIKPTFWGSLYQFKYTYLVLEEKFRWIYDKRQRRSVKQRELEVVGYKNMEQLAQKFSEVAIIRSLHYNVDFIYKTAQLDAAGESFYKIAAEGLFSGMVESKNKTQGSKKKVEEVDFGSRLHDLQRVVSNSHKDFKRFEDDYITEKEVLLFDTIKEIADREEAQLIYFSYRETLERVKYILSKVKDHYGIKNVYEIHGDIPQKRRKQIEKILGPRDIVLITSAGTESINLQRANNLIFYEIPFALRQFIQACGRITRADSQFERFRVYVLEVENTIDTYKKQRIVANSELIQVTMKGSNLLMTGLLQVSLDDVKAMKDELLWRR